MRITHETASRFRTPCRSVLVLFVLVMAAALSPLCVSALTVRAKSDLRLWEAVTDLAQPLSWPWTSGADAAELTFSNRLTQAVSSTSVTRITGAWRGSCSHPVSPLADEALVVATLVQLSGGVEISRETVELAYVPGSAGRAMTVRTMADRDWRRVRLPRVAGFDARWWNVTGPSGYEVMWAEPPGWHCVVRAFEGEGVVDEVVLKFGTLGLMMLIR